MKNTRPYFFWDYDITEEEIRKILSGDDLERKCWIAARILECALWQDIWKFLTVTLIAQLLPHLRMKQRDRELWEYAINRWQNANASSKNWQTTC